MELANETKISWISAEQACELLGIKFDTLRKCCSQGKYEYMISKKGRRKEYKILASSLPADINELYHSCDNDLSAGLMEYNKAPAWARKQADKYIEILTACKMLKGYALKDFVDEWNVKNPDFKTSFSRIMYYRKEYEERGIAGLIAKPTGRTGKSKIQPEWFEYFKNLYLVEGAPTLESCYRAVKGRFSPKSNNFPTARTFLRKLEREVPKQSVYLARFGYSKWNKTYANYIERDYSNVIANQCWVSDHAQIDVQVVNKDGKVFSPWVTAFRCFKTNKWLGWLLHEEAGNSDHIFQSFYYAALKFGLPEEIYIDNGKDYRCGDFAGGRTGNKNDKDIHSSKGLLSEKNRASLKLLGIEAHFSLPYNAQTKPIERDFKNIKEFLSKHTAGYRGGNVTERPEKLRVETSGNKLLGFSDFKEIFDDFIENVLNKLPSSSKKLRGKSPDELFAEEFTTMKTVSKDSLMLFCMRTSKTVTIGRNGIKDSQLGISYWEDWMSAYKGEKVYIRRDINAYQECWVFSATTDEFIGKGKMLELVPALAKTDIEKAVLKKATKIKKADTKAAKAGAKVDSIDINIKIADVKNGIIDNAKELDPKIMQISKNQMDKAVKQARDLERAGTYDLAKFVPKEEKKRKIYLFESDKQADLERGVL